MNRKCISHIAKVLCAAMGAFAVATPLAACDKDRGEYNAKTYSNEETPLVLATDALDGVFNPFFYTSGSDGEVVAQTQIGMLTSDTSGQPKAGWDEACVAFDYSTVQTGTETGEGGDKDYSSFYTDYYFAIKDNVRFSDGVLLTSDDVLFNIYMYLDPAYTGSSTMYSVDIQGLTAYRAQSEDEGEGNATDAYYDIEAASRVNMIYDWIDNKDAKWSDLENYEYYDVVDEPNWKVIKKDVEKAEEYFKEELESDYVVAMASDPEKDYEKYKGEDGKVLITENWQVFLLMYNIIKFESHYEKDSNKVAYYTLVNDYSLDTEKETLINYVFDSFLGKDLKTDTMIDSYKDGLFKVITYYATARRLVSYVRSSCINHDLNGEMPVPTVKGIEILKNQSAIPYSNTPVNKGDNVPTRALKDEEENAKSYDVLHIRINGVDPKAIQNFSFTVAPGHYYSSEWNRVVNGETNFFGVKFSDPDFMQSVRTKLVPRGAGPYRATTRDGASATSTVAKSDFLNNNIVYLERNDNFLLGAPKIKKLRFKVVSSNKLYDAVLNEEVHYASPSMEATTVQKLEASNELTYAKADNLGYGYIGISAKYIPNIYIRRAIMTTLDPSLPVTYYGGSNYASAIYRPMSKTLWTYQDSWGPYKDEENDYEYDETGTKAIAYLQKAGCKWDGKSYTYNGNKLKYTFTIAGDSDDHPAQSMLKKSMEILNTKCGMEITLSHDSTALSKLANGQLTVWAAAWSSSSDPDMYQVYHKDSKATSTLAWGYDFIQSDKNNDATKGIQQTILKDLSELIDNGRKTLSKSERIEIYDEAQSFLMQLAVEFPTYQRKVYYVWRRGVFNESTMFTGADVSTYQSPLSEIWNVSFNEG